MSYFYFIRCGVLALSVLLYSHISIAAPLSGPAASNETNAYGEDIFPDNDITNDEPSDSEKAEQFEHARMAFLFGQYKLAFAGWEPLANEGYGQAQATLAWMYHTGKGVTKNLRTAHYWYTRAANQSHVIAKNNLGVFYEQGLGVRENMRLAAEMYLDAAQSGYAYAQYNVGMLYHDGRGVKKNKKEAIFWLQVAALQGVTQAQDVLESMGRKVVIPQHTKVIKRIKEKSDTPKWHKRKVQATVTSSRKEKTENIYKKHRSKLADAANNTSKRAEKFTKANKTNKSTKKKPPAKASATKITRTQKLLERNRALAAKKPSSVNKTKQTGKTTKTVAKERKSNKKNRLSKDAHSMVSLNKSTSLTKPKKTTKANKSRNKTIRAKTLLADKWIKKQNPRQYTLQLAGSNDLNKIKSLANLLGKEKNSAYYHTKKKGKKWYGLVYGVYSTRGAAQKKIKTLPREFKKMSPWIRRFSEVQTKITK